MYLRVHTLGDVEQHLTTIREAAARTQAWLRSHDGNAMELLKSLKFESIGCHPIAGHDLNAVEQINQTFTYAVALHAARELLRLHPKAGGFRLAPGAHASLPLDIMSEAEGLVGAETFAAVTPTNNRKLHKDLDKLAVRTERYRYIFFAAPAYPRTERLPHLEREGIQVWSLAI